MSILYNRRMTVSEAAERFVPDLRPGALNMVYGTMPARQRLALLDAQLRNEVALAELRERDAWENMKVIEGKAE
jgi:hypothetical protein